MVKKKALYPIQTSKKDYSDNQKCGWLLGKHKKKRTKKTRTTTHTQLYVHVKDYIFIYKIGDHIYTSSSSYF